MKKLIPNDAVLIPDGARCAFRGMIFDTYQWPQQLFDDSEHTFEMLKRTDTATVICVTDNKILVVDDEQPHLGKRCSFPGGRVDDTDETVEAAARRETLEETGREFTNWRLVKVSQPYRKIEWFVYVFLAWEPAGRQTPRLDPGEQITVRELDFGELKQQIMDGTGYLGESRDIFQELQNIDDLLQLPEFTGREVDR